MIKLSEWLKDELEARAVREAPAEACGLISRTPLDDRAHPGRIHLWDALNASENPESSFMIAPRSQFDILHQIELLGHELIGIYHSHPRSGPAPSATDKTLAALWPSLDWVIVGFDDDGGALFWAGRP